VGGTRGVYASVGHKRHGRPNGGQATSATRDVGWRVVRSAPAAKDSSEKVSRFAKSPEPSSTDSGWGDGRTCEG
jgi:hypothetical protein